VEVFDRCDGLLLYALRGGMSMSSDEGVQLSVSRRGCAEAHHAFTPVSRDPVHRRIRSILDLSHALGYACRLCVRLSVRDATSGMAAVLCSMDGFRPRVARVGHLGGHQCFTLTINMSTREGMEGPLTKVRDDIDTIKCAFARQPVRRHVL
jgi:hypothetical protein